jgi:predicted RNA binding protein YcfA (HicA-like mRNA interferase family)
MKQYNRREFEKILSRNGFTCARQDGKHSMWQRGSDSVAVPKHKLNFMICRRLIKTYSLQEV